MGMRSRLRLGVIGSVLLATLFGGATAAHATGSDPIGGITLPSETARVWIELEQSGLSGDAVSVRAENGASIVDVTMTPTTFGLHGEIAAVPGALKLTILPKPGAPATRPDLAVTVLDAQGQVLQSANLRLAIPAGPAKPGEEPKPAVPGTDTDSQQRGAKGKMARTGGEEPIWLALAGALLVVAGGTVWGVRRVRASREEVAR